MPRAGAVEVPEPSGAPWSARAGGAAARVGVKTALAPLFFQAAAAGLPTSELLQKAREGVAKRVATPMIAQVLGQLVGHLKASRAQLPKVHRGEGALVETLAQARVAGLAATDIHKLLTVASPEGKLELKRFTQLGSVGRAVRELGVDSARATALIIVLHRYDASALTRPSRLIGTLNAVRRLRRTSFAVVADRAAAACGQHILTLLQ